MTEIPVKYESLEQGWTFIRIPKYDMYLGIMTVVIGTSEVVENGRVKMDSEGKPIIGFKTNFVVRIFTKDEYNVQRKGDVLS